MILLSGKMLIPARLTEEEHPGQKSDHKPGRQPSAWLQFAFQKQIDILYSGVLCLSQAQVGDFGLCPSKLSLPSWVLISSLGSPWSLIKSLSGIPFYLQNGASLIAQLVKNPPAMQKTQVRFLGQEDPLEKGQATHSSILRLPQQLNW